MDQALAQQYSENVAKDAEKKAEKQKKRWSKVEKQMDRLSVKDQKVENVKQRAANAAAMLGVEDMTDSSEYDDTQIEA